MDLFYQVEHSNQPQLNLKAPLPVIICFSSTVRIRIDCVLPIRIEINNQTSFIYSFKLINEILLTFNNKLTVGGIFCDLEKAFDSVNHDILLSKCEFYGFSGKTNALLRSYLSTRYQRVLINNSPSNTYYYLFRMGQNKTRRSSRFNTWSFVLLNLPNIIADLSKPILFADDTSIIITNPSPSKFQEDINDIIDNITHY
jgi:hypothetical protein